MQKGSLDLEGAVVELTVNSRSGMDWVVKIQTPTTYNVLELAVPSRQDALDWMLAIRETIKSINSFVSYVLDYLKNWRLIPEIRTRDLGILF